MNNNKNHLGSGGVSGPGILDSRWLPDEEFTALWQAIILEQEVKDRLLSQAILNFTLRPQINRAALPLHGIILLVGVPGTGKTSLARGLASQTAKSLNGDDQFLYIEVEPHGLASAALGKSQKAVTELLGTTISEHAQLRPLIVLLDEVETLAADRTKMSLDANPVDVHRATDAVLAQLDQLATRHSHLLFLATSNFPKAIDSAFLSRADLIVTLDLPGPEACRKILADTLNTMSEAFPNMKRILAKPEFDEATKLCQGLDGRRIRKLVTGACTFSKETALDPNQLTVEDLIRAIKHEQKELMAATGGPK